MKLNFFLMCVFNLDILFRDILLCSNLLPIFLFGSFIICGVLYISWTQALCWFRSLYSLSFRSLSRVFWWSEVSNFNVVQCINFISYRTSQFWLAIFQVLNSHLHCDGIGQRSSKVLLFCFSHIDLLCS